MDMMETVVMMGSPDYKERFKAEYFQLKIRIEKLENMLNAWVAGALNFQPTCPYELLKAQLHAMKCYQHLLEERARIENVKL